MPGTERISHRLTALLHLIGSRRQIEPVGSIGEGGEGGSPHVLRIGVRLDQRAGQRRFLLVPLPIVVEIVIDDALHATRAAAEEGVVPGGGVALLRCLKAARSVDLKGDEKLGAEILANALRAPARWIANNAGENGDIIVEKILEKDGNFGFNAEKMEFGDMMEMGVIDPTKVVRLSLENAVSAAGMLLTSECAVVERPKEDKDKDSGVPDFGGF